MAAVRQARAKTRHVKSGGGGGGCSEHEDRLPVTSDSSKHHGADPVPSRGAGGRQLGGKHG